MQTDQRRGRETKRERVEAAVSSPSKQQYAGEQQRDDVDEKDIWGRAWRGNQIMVWLW